MKDNIKNIKTVAELHKFNNIEPPLHPQLSIHRIEDLPAYSNNLRLDFTLNFFTIGLKENITTGLKYGRKEYDFQTGVMTFTAPRQVMSIDSSDEKSEERGWLILFHSDLISSYPLAKKIRTYHFFDYSLKEALHLSAMEKATVNEIFNNINQEYNTRIDRDSKNILLSNLDLLLSYCNRFYKRQFVLRNDSDSFLVEQFEHVLNEYFFSTQLNDLGIPSVRHFSDQLNVSPNYLSDMLQQVTGKSTLEYIHEKIIEEAKILLLGTNSNISEIAYLLGYKDPAYFTRFYKKKVGVTPKEFRKHRN